MILDFARGHFIEQLLCTRDFCLLNRSEFKALHRYFGFGNKENMLDLTLIESDCPVRRVVTHRSWNSESSRKLCVNAHFLGCVQILSKFSLNTFFGGKDSAVEFSFDAYCRYLSHPGKKAPYFYDAFPSLGNLCIELVPSVFALYVIPFWKININPIMVLVTSLKSVLPLSSLGSCFRILIYCFFKCR